jgi:hypothetical protein
VSCWAASAGVKKKTAKAHSANSFRISLVTSRPRYFKLQRVAHETAEPQMRGATRDERTQTGIFILALRLAKIVYQFACNPFLAQDRSGQVEAKV